MKKVIAAFLNSKNSEVSDPPFIRRPQGPCTLADLYLPLVKVN